MPGMTDCDRMIRTAVDKATRPAWGRLVLRKDATVSGDTHYEVSLVDDEPALAPAYEPTWRACHEEAPE